MNGHAQLAILLSPFLPKNTKNDLHAMFAFRGGKIRFELININIIRHQHDPTEADNFTIYHVSNFLIWHVATKIVVVLHNLRFTYSRTTI